MPTSTENLTSPSNAGWFGGNIEFGTAATPEPASLTLLGLGGLGLAGYGWRRRKQAGAA